MVPPERRDRRPRQSDQVIDLRQAAASRNRGGEDAGVPDRGDLDLAAGDQALLDSVRRHAGPSLLPQLHEVGRHVGSAAVRRLAADVEGTPPRLDGFDARGDRVDRVVAHPGWDRLQREGVEAGLGGRPWASSEPHAHLARGAGLLLWAQTSASSAMALSTHYAATAALVDTPGAAVWLPRLASRRLETGSRRAAAKPGCSAGIALTEQGSSAPGAVPATSAVAALGGPLEGGPTWRLRGRKWFAGNVDADVLVVDAATEDGVGTFLVPRQLVDGRDNDLRTVRLRQGHALRAWVVGDVELDGAWAVRLDGAGRSEQGTDQPSARTSAQTSALHAARTLDAGLLAAAALRAALSRAGHHARHRAVPGGPLDTAPMVRTLLADIAVESESATVLALRLAAATDAALAGRAPTTRPGGATPHGDGPGAPSDPDRRHDVPGGPPDQGAHGGPTRPDAPPARSEHVRAEAARTDPAYEAALLRLAGPVSAMWLSRRAPQVSLEAHELLGATAWDDTSELARVHRDASAVLAGRTGNGLALQVVDVVSRDTDAVEAFLAECERARGGHPRLDAAVSACADLLRTAAVEARQDPDAVAGAARWLVERLAVTLQASLVVRECPTPVAEAYLAARLDGAGTRALGALPLGSRQTALVVDRALGDV